MRALLCNYWVMCFSSEFLDILSSQWADVIYATIWELRFSIEMGKNLKYMSYIKEKK